MKHAPFPAPYHPPRLGAGDDVVPRDVRVFTEGMVKVDALWLVWLLAMANIAILKYLLLGWWPA